MIQVFADHHGRDIPEGGVGEILQALAGKQHAGDDVRIDAVVRAPVVVILFDHGLLPFAEPGLRRGAVPGGAAQVQVRAEAQQRAVENFVAQGYAAENRLAVRALSNSGAGP